MRQYCLLIKSGRWIREIFIKPGNSPPPSLSSRSTSTLKSNGVVVKIWRVKERGERVKKEDFFTGPFSFAKLLSYSEIVFYRLQMLAGKASLFFFKIMNIFFKQLKFVFNLKFVAAQTTRCWTKWSAVSTTRSASCAVSSRGRSWLLAGAPLRPPSPSTWRSSPLPWFPFIYLVKKEMN